MFRRKRYTRRIDGLHFKPYITTLNLNVYVLLRLEFKKKIYDLRTKENVH